MKRDVSRNWKRIIAPVINFQNIDVIVENSHMNGYPKRKEQTNKRINHLLSLLSEKVQSNYVIVYYDVPERNKT